MTRKPAPLDPVARHVMTLIGDMASRAATMSVPLLRGAPAAVVDLISSASRAAAVAITAGGIPARELARLRRSYATSIEPRDGADDLQMALAALAEIVRLCLTATDDDDDLSEHTWLSVGHVNELPALAHESMTDAIILAMRSPPIVEEEIDGVFDDDMDPIDDEKPRTGYFHLPDVV